MSQPLRKTLTIVNDKGLHARASAKLVELAEDFNARATVSFNGVAASADSIMGLLMLGAAKGARIDLEVSGEQAAALADALEALIANRFGEPT